MVDLSVDDKPLHRPLASVAGKDEEVDAGGDIHNVDIAFVLAFGT
jgi:hypothetical protein